jgi:tetratricopeptide (TPR) repeat protein
MKILARIRSKIYSVLHRDALKRQKRALLVIFVLTFLGVGWVVFVSRINNAYFYLNLANQQLIELSQNGSDAELVGEIKTNVRRAVMISPYDGAVAEGAAQITEALAKYDPEAAELASGYYDLVVQLEPLNAKMHLKLANIHLASERYSSALALVDEVIRLDPKLADGHLTRAIVLEQIGDFDRAIESAKTSILLGDNDRAKFTLARLLYNRGSSKRGQGANSKFTDNADLRAAKDLLSSLSVTGKEQLNALYLLAKLELRLGNKTKAQVHANKLVMLLPEGDQKNKTKNEFKNILGK